jgi:hypothetical protein
MIRTVPIAAIAVFLSGIFLPGSAWAASATIKWQKYPDDTDAPARSGMPGRTTKEKKDAPAGFYPALAKRIETKAEKPAGKWDIPAKGLKDPLYAVIRLGDDDRLLILDRKNKGDEECTVLLFDRDGDGKLSKDSPLAGEITKEGRILTQVAFPAVDARIKVGGKPAVYSFKVLLTYFAKEVMVDDSERMYCQVLANCCYAGTLQLFGKRFSVVLGDGDLNGRFDDRPAPPAKDAGKGRETPAGDRIYLAVAGTKMDERNGSMLGDLMAFKDKTFKVGIDTAAKKLNLSPYEKNLGTLKLPMPVTFMSLYGEKEKKSIVVVSPSEKVKIPQDTYKLIEYRVIANDKQGDVWFLSAEGTDETPSICIGTSVASPSFGQPFVPMADVRKSTGSKVALVFKVVGVAKELVREVQHIEGTKTKSSLSSVRKDRPKEATFTVATTSGKVEARGSFQYG